MVDILIGILGGLFGSAIADFFAKRRWLFNFLLGFLLVFIFQIFVSIKDSINFEEVLHFTIFNKNLYVISFLVVLFFMVIGALGAKKKRTEEHDSSL